MIDIVGCLNTEWTTGTTPQKIAMLNDYCSARGYKETVSDPSTGEMIANPVTKKMFMNTDLINHVKGLVHGERKKQADLASIWELIEGME